MRIFILPKTGIQESEKYAVQRIENEFPREWRGYASLEIADKRILQRELDLVLLTHDRVLIVELKRWNGQIKSEGGYWYLNGNRKDASPVKKNNDKAKILKSIIERNIKNGVTILVDSRVVLCGDSPRPTLEEDERASVLQLEEFLKAKEEKHYARLFPKKPWATSPLKQFDEFETLFKRSSYIKAKEFSWQNYRVDGVEIFKHPRNLYREYKAVNRDDSNAKALLRRWDYSQLGAAAPTQGDWINLAHREGRVYSYVRSKTDELEGVMLLPIGNVPAGQVTTDHCELFELPIKQKRLFEFAELYRDKIALGERVALVKVLLSKFAELHRVGVAHRDIGDHCIWLERPQSVKLSGFVMAHFPQMDTVGALRDTVSAITTRFPEDVLGDKSSTNFHRDVFLLGVVAHVLIFGEAPPLDTELPKWVPRHDDPTQGRLDEWFENSLNWVAKDRYGNAGAMLDALNDIKLEGDGDAAIPISTFEHFQAKTTIRLYKELSDVEERDGAEIYRSEHNGTPCYVKIWYGLKPDGAKPGLNVSLLRFLEKAKAIQYNASEWLPRILDVGLTNRGLLYVREWLDGQTLEEWLGTNPGGDDRLSVCRDLVNGVCTLHAGEIGHGDIHPRNVVVLTRAQGSQTCSIKFIDTPDFKGEASEVVTTAYAAPNFERLSTFERDRYAVVVVISEVLVLTRNEGAQSAFAGPEVCAAIAHCFNATPAILTLEPLLQALESALNPEENQKRRLTVTLGNIPLGIKVGPMLSDNGAFYVETRHRNAELDQIFVVGPGTQLKLTVNVANRTLKYVDVEKITHTQFRFKSRPAASVRFECEIYLEQGPSNEVQDLVDALFAIPGLLEPEAMVSSETGELSGVELNEEVSGQPTFISTATIWENLIEAEEEALPEIVVTGDVRWHPTREGIQLVPYESDSSLDYAPDEEVEVFQFNESGEKRKVGTLEQRLTNAEALAIGNARLSLSTVLGARMTLQSRQDRSSYERRQNAVKRILSRRAVIPSLVSYFERDGAGAKLMQHDAPTEEELQEYEIFDGEKRIFSLNEGQRAALQRLLGCGPVGLLQGPPGTGKTSFIAAFLHYVVSRQGAQNILLVSQSHEATNNALEKTLELADATGLTLNVVRVGESSVLSEAIRHVGVSAIQESYREKFRSEFKHRICSIGTRLGLSKSFIEDYCDAMIQLLRLVEEIGQLNSEIRVDLAEEEKSTLLQRVAGRSDDFWGIAESVYQVSRSDDIPGAMREVRERIVHLHEVKSPDAVERLDRLIRISREWVEVLAAESGNFAEFLARTRTIVAGTCVGVGRWNLGVADNTYDWVIIDEAARSTPSELAVAMQVGRRVLLVGDHFQLPPQYKDELRAAMAKRLGVSVQADIFQSDFERAFESPYGKSVGASLLTQYRMAPAIGQLVSECFYKPRGKDLVTGRGKPPQYYDALPPELGSEVIWVDTSSAGVESRETRAEGEKSTRNPFEARTVVDVLRHLLTCDAFVDGLLADIRPGEIPVGVIAMYSAQVVEIHRALARAEWIGEMRRHVKVDTVDSYQGKENRIVVLSLVRNNTEYRQGFLQSANRLNVAMSRAMDRLVIVGAGGMWRRERSDSPLAHVLQHIQRNADPGRFEVIDAAQFRS